MHLLGLIEAPAVSMPSYALEVAESMMETPPELNPHDQWKLAAAKPKAKPKSKKAKAKANKAKAGKASFKRKVMSPPEPAANEFDVASESEALPVPPIWAGPVPEMNKFNAQELIEFMQEICMPVEAWPDDIPTGKFSYTKYGLFQTRLEVNIKQRHFRVIQARDCVGFEGSPNSTWGHSSSLADCWETVKARSGFDPKPSEQPSDDEGT
jgi:hypothetical protein